MTSNSESLAALHFATWSAYAVGAVKMTAAIELQEPEIETPSSPSRVPYTTSSIRPSVKYVEVEGPNKRFLRQVLAPPRPVLPRKQSRSHAPPIGLRQRVPLSSSLTGKCRTQASCVALPIQLTFAPMLTPIQQKSHALLRKSDSMINTAACNRLREGREDR